MVAVKCKSGKHSYDSSQTEALAKCCNGYVTMLKPWGNEENGGYDKRGDWWGVTVFVPEDDKEEINRLKALQYMERRANSKGPATPM